MSMPIVKPIHAREGEAIDIHWHTKTAVMIERRTCPLITVLEARTKPDVSDSTVPADKTDAI